MSPGPVGLGGSDLRGRARSGRPVPGAARGFGVGFGNVCSSSGPPLPPAFFPWRPCRKGEGGTHPCDVLGTWFSDCPFPTVDRRPSRKRGRDAPLEVEEVWRHRGRRVRTATVGQVTTGQF